MLHHKKSIIELTKLLILILTCVIFSYIPNIFMSSSNNYIAPRMLGSVGMILPMTLAFLFLKFKDDKNKVIKYIFIVIVSFNFLYLWYSYFTNFRMSLKTYSSDYEYISILNDEIEYYEKKFDVKIKTVYYGYDQNISYHYDGRVVNGFNYRIQAIDWAFCGYLSALAKEDYNYYHMSNDEVVEKFGVIDYNAFDHNQLIFKQDSIYILLY